MKQILGRNIYRLLNIIGLICLINGFAYAQVNPSDSSRVDSSQVAEAATPGDTLVLEGDIKTTIVYFARDSVVSDFQTEVLYLYGDAKVTYGDVELTAAQIEIDQNTNIVTARGIPDSTGKLQNTPVFKQAGDLYEADSMRYNFKTEKGVITGIVTQQGEGYIQSSRAKRDNEGFMYAQGNRYTTCNLKHPHWYIRTNKIKMIPEKAVVSGPFNVVIADVPTPVGLPFGIFPFTEGRSSGIIVPVYGEAVDRGFFLRQGGYYWAINDYVAATFLGEIYTNGSWGLDFSANYRKRYRYSGGASVRFNRRLGGEEGADRTRFDDFWVRWNHSPVSRGRSSFSASVNFGSSSYNERNSFNPNDQLSNSFNSNVSYSTAFDIGPASFTTSISARHDQNSRTEIMNVIFPAFNLGMNRIFPFKKQGQSPKNVIQNINFAYNFTANARFTNEPNLGTGFPFTVANRPDGESIDTLSFNPANFSQIAQQAKIGGIHNIPISTTLKLFRYISLNPSFNLTAAWYPQRLNYTWDNDAQAVRVDTLRQFSQVYSYTAAANLTTRIYGTFNFGKKRKIQAVRHTIVPTVGFSYAPDLSADRFGFFQTVQVDTTGRTQSVSRYLGFQPGAPVSTNQSGVINFNLQNILEAKLRPKNDTAEARKVPLLENLSLAGNYNLVADSLNLSQLTLAARTRLFDMIDFNFTGRLDPYAYRLDSVTASGSIFQRRVNEFAWNSGQGIGQLNTMNISLSTNLTPEAFKRKTREKAKEMEKRDDLSEGERQELANIQRNPQEYVDFDVPWSLNLSYNLSYNKVGFQESRVTQQINFSGDVSLTKTWKIGFRSGYDFDQKQLSYTNLNVFKDLHCWQMTFNWNPFGRFQSYSFDLAIKASILQDLKITRQRSWYDRELR